MNDSELIQTTNFCIFLTWIVGGGVQLCPLGTAATNRPIMPTLGDYDEGECGGMMTGRRNEVLGEILPQCRFVHNKSHMLCLGRRGVKPGTNRLRYGTATHFCNLPSKCIYKTKANFITLSSF
jgi:hypothetical protein